MDSAYLHLRLTFLPFHFSKFFVELELCAAQLQKSLLLGDTPVVVEVSDALVQPWVIPIARVRSVACSGHIVVQIGVVLVSFHVFTFNQRLNSLFQIRGLVKGNEIKVNYFTRLDFKICLANRPEMGQSQASNHAFWLSRHLEIVFPTKKFYSNLRHEVECRNYTLKLSFSSSESSLWGPTSIFSFKLFHLDSVGLS